MYEVFYGLKEKPFSLLPDPSYLYLSEKHQMALTLLDYSLINQAGFCVISGVTGAGKTTLIRYLLNQLGDNVAVGLITNTHQSFNELLRWILMAFNLDYRSDSKPQLYQTFVDFLIEQYAKNRNTVLIVDEAQNMSIEALEELRMLSNINADKDQVLQIVLVGQPGLRAKLSRADMEQFAQRIVVDYYIEALSAEETHHYIRHRLTIAGGDPELFEKDAVQSIYRHSNGTPRLINLLCEGALVYAFAEGCSRISTRLVDAVVRERQAHGLLPQWQSESRDAISLQSDSALEVDRVKSDITPAPLDCAPPVPLPMPLKDESQTAALHNSERVGAVVSGSCDEGELAAQHTIDVPQQVYFSAAADEVTSTAMPQGAPASERRVGVISKLVHLDTWSRNVTGQGQTSRHVTRTEVKPQMSSIAGGHAQKPEQTHAAKSKGRDTESPGDGGSSSSVDAEGASRQMLSTDEANRAVVAAYTNEDRLTDSHHFVSRRAGLDAGGRWIVATALGFSGGLMVAVVLFALIYFKLGADITAALSPVDPLPPSTTVVTPSVPPPAAAENTPSADQAMLEALQRERDAALAQTRALERERDAALATVKVRELTNAAELSAAQAREREKAATLEAIKAQERARTAELAAMVARERERAAALAAASAQVNKLTAEPKPAPPVEATSNVSPAKLIEAEPHAESKSAAVPPPAAAASEKPTAAEAPAKFSANPCKGPSAKFLSTCKE